MESNQRLLAVSYGGGTNSTAMLCGFLDRGIKPDLILFADTGAEMPHTYTHVEFMRGKVKEWWGMDIEIVRKTYQGGFEGLEGQCMRRGELPSLAYGRRACSIKYKGEPQDKRLEKELKTRGIKWSKPPTNDELAADGMDKWSWCEKNGIVPPVVKALGFDAAESHRVGKRSSRPDLFTSWYPLVEWNWRRQECVAAICRHGLPQPGKSSCYFCPAMKKREVVKLRETNPELFAKAIAIEDAAQKTIRTPRGLGGDKNLWRDWIKAYDAQGRFDGFDFIEPAHVPCGCYDGGEG